MYCSFHSVDRQVINGVTNLLRKVVRTEHESWMSAKNSFALPMRNHKSWSHSLDYFGTKSIHKIELEYLFRFSEQKLVLRYMASLGSSFGRSRSRRRRGTLNFK